jgi:hypothetical protein
MVQKGGVCLSGQSLKISCYVREILITIPAETMREQWVASSKMTLIRERGAILSAEDI